MVQKTERSDRGSAGSKARFERSHVVLVDRGDDELRPYVILNTKELPNYGEQYIGAPLTTKPTGDAIELHPRDWSAGAMDRTCYALASDVTAFYDWKTEKLIGELGRRPADAIARRVGRYIGLIG